MTMLFVLMPSLLLTWLVYVIALARGQLRINFTRSFKVFTKLPESRSRVYHIKGKIIEAIFIIFLPQLSFLVAHFSPRLCTLLENVSPVVRTSFCVFFFSLEKANNLVSKQF